MTVPFINYVVINSGQLPNCCECGGTQAVITDAQLQAAVLAVLAANPQLLPVLSASTYAAFQSTLPLMPGSGPWNNGGVIQNP
jgi:hypothetical protein